MDILTSLPKALASESSSPPAANSSEDNRGKEKAQRRSSMTAKAKMDPIATLEAPQNATAINRLAFRFSIPSINLEVYGSQALSASKLKEASISRFRLGKASLDYKTMSDDSVQAEVSLKSFTMTNTRPGKSVYRELIPQAKHDGDQL